jgi:hypothetical protein
MNSGESGGDVPLSARRYGNRSDKALWLNNLHQVFSHNRILSWSRHSTGVSEHYHWREIVGEAKRRKLLGLMTQTSDVPAMLELGMILCSERREPMSVGFADFVEEMRQGMALRVSSNQHHAKVEVTPVPREYTRYNWAIPSFDFGHLYDPKSSASIGLERWNSEWQPVTELLENEQFRLPFDECAFIFRYGETLLKYATTNIVHVYHDEDRSIVGHTWFQQEVNDAVKQRWTMMPFQFVVHQGSPPSVEINFSTPRLTSDVEADYREDCKAKYTEVLIATLLMSTNAAHEGQDERTAQRIAQVNRGREFGKLPPLPMTRFIHIDKTVITRAATATCIGSPKRPHDRRGHYRTLRSGKRVEVSPSKIHGGSEVAPCYRVELD